MQDIEPFYRSGDDLRYPFMVVIYDGKRIIRLNRDKNFDEIDPKKLPRASRTCRYRQLIRHFAAKDVSFCDTILKT